MCDIPYCKKDNGGFMIENLKKCFAINLSDYDNINFSLEINKVVLGTCIALIVGIIVLNLTRSNMRLMITQLTRHKATGEESAKTLRELGLADSRIVKRLLSGNNTLSKTVARVGEVKYDYETYKAMDKKARAEAEKIDFESARFYIKESEVTRASFISERYTSTVTGTVLASALVAILGICVIISMPGILDAINELLESVNK